MKDFIKNMSSHEIDPRLSKPMSVKPVKTPLAKSPVVARIRKTQFGNSTDMPTGINVNQVSSNAAKLFAKAPKLSIKKL